MTYINVEQQWSTLMIFLAIWLHLLLIVYLFVFEPKYNIP